MTAVDIEVLTSRIETLPYIPQVIEAADKERNSFGFLPDSAYEDFALQGRLFVARDRETGELAGYIVFGGTSPQARIFQTYVAPAYRRSGVGRALVEEVVRRAEEQSYLSIRIEAASDLIGANEFYKNSGFRFVRERAGGKTRNRTIVTRVRELNSPSLLDFAAYGTADGPAISLTLSTAAPAPLYLIDLNVLFDITKRRGNAVGAGRVLAAAMDNSVSLAVASEFVTELERNTKVGKPDPILELARALPRLKTPHRVVIAAHREILAPLLFPERWDIRTITKQD
jgi:ribosomal protein S18 acetylase RimI-like enzyme